MQPRFVGRLGLADLVTVANAGLGFAAAVAATAEPALGARLILLAAVADGLDGVLARNVGSTSVGEFIDSLADVASFCVAPAIFVYSVASAEWGLTLSGTDPPALLATAVVVPALFVGSGVVRLGMYTAYDIGSEETEGVQTTLAATIIAVVYLAGIPGARGATALLAMTVVFTYLMVTTVTYPELRPAHALAMGAVQAGAIVAPTAFGRVLPRTLLVGAVLYLIGPWFYRRYLVDAPEDGPDEGPDPSPGAETE